MEYALRLPDYAFSRQTRNWCRLRTSATAKIDVYIGRIALYPTFLSDIAPEDNASCCFLSLCISCSVKLLNRVNPIDV